MHLIRLLVHNHIASIIFPFSFNCLLKTTNFSLVSSCLCNNRNLTTHSQCGYLTDIIIHSLLFIVIYIYMYTRVCMVCARAQLVRERENVEATTLCLLWAFLSISLFSYVHFLPLVQCFLSMYKITFSYTDSLLLYLLSQIFMSKKICMFF